MAETGWKAAPAFERGGARFIRADSLMTPVSGAAIGYRDQTRTPPDLLLIGCVKAKRSGHHRAEDLYCSTLFGYRLEWAKKSAARWFILSARHHLLAPDDEVE